MCFFLKTQDANIISQWDFCVVRLYKNFFIFVGLKTGLTSDALKPNSVTARGECDRHMPNSRGVRESVVGCFDDNTRLEPSISEQLARNAQALRRQAYSAQTLHQLKITKYRSKVLILQRLDKGQRGVAMSGAEVAEDRRCGGEDGEGERFESRVCYCFPLHVVSPPSFFLHSSLAYRPRSSPLASG